MLTNMTEREMFYYDQILTDMLNVAYNVNDCSRAVTIRSLVDLVRIECKKGIEKVPELKDDEYFMIKIKRLEILYDYLIIGRYDLVMNNEWFVNE